MTPDSLAQALNTLAQEQEKLAEFARDQAGQAAELARSIPMDMGGGHSFLMGLTVFMLACFVGYYVVWRVTPALHAPLMAVTNAISSVIILGALIAAGPQEMTAAGVMGLVAVALASVNIFGGFMVTQRMLAMYRKKTPSA